MAQNRTAAFLAPLLIFVGLMVTLENFQVIHGVSRHWPVFLLILGAGFVMLFFQRQRQDSVLLWLGTFIACLAVFFYYLNFTAWSRLAWLWPVFLGIVGVSFLCVGLALRKGLYLYFSGAFVALFIVLTLVFSVSMRLWPMSLAVFGASLMVLESLHRER